MRAVPLHIWVHSPAAVLPARPYKTHLAVFTGGELLTYPRVT